MGSSTSLRAEGTKKALFLLKADPRVLHLPRLFYFALNIPASRGWSSHPQSQGWCGSRPQVINARLHLSVSPAAGCKVGAPPAWPQAPRLCVLCRNLPSFLGRISNSSWLRAAPRIAPKGPTAFLRHGNPAAQTPPSFLAPCCAKHAVPTCSEQHDSHSFFNLKKRKKKPSSKNGSSAADQVWASGAGVQALPCVNDLQGHNTSDSSDGRAARALNQQCYDNFCGLYC